MNGDTRQCSRLCGICMYNSGYVSPPPYIDDMMPPYYCVFFCAVALCCSVRASAQWKKLPGPTGGNVSALHVRGNDVYAGLNGGFVYYSNDGAASWRQVSSPVQRNTISSFASTDTYLYAGTHSGLFRSADKGLTWVDVSEGLPNWIYKRPYVTCLAMHRDILVAGTIGGPCKTTDDGETWSVPGDDFFDVRVVDLAFGGDVLYAVYSNGLHRSYDKGDTWHEVGQGLIHESVACVAAEGSVVVCGSAGNHAYRSHDQGNTWRAVGDDSEWIFRDLAVHDSQVWACSGENIYRLSVIETEWLVKCNDPDAKNCYSLAFQGPNIFAGTGHEGIFRSSNGGASWSRVNNALYAAHISAVCAKRDTLFAGVGSSGIFRSINGGADWTWRDANVNIGQVFISMAAKGPNVFAGASRSGISISNDDGDTWRWHVSMLDPEVFQVQQILVNGNDIWIVSFGAVYKSTDDGFSWTEFKSGLPNVQITSICLLANSVFVGTRGFGVYRSTDDGATWVAGKYPMNERRIAKMISHDGMLFAGTSRDGDDGTTYRSSDSGATWKALRSGLPRGECTAFAVADTFLFVSIRDSGLYSSTNLGAEWTRTDSTLTQASITSLSVSDTDLYVGTRGDGIWKRPIVELPTSVERDVSVRTLPSPGLSVYPSVTNAEVTIDFTLINSGPVSLNIFNIQGQCVATLVSNDLDAGKHSIQWDPFASSSDPSFTAAGPRCLLGGVYYVRLHCENLVQSTPLLIAR